MKFFNNQSSSTGVILVLIFATVLCVITVTSLLLSDDIVSQPAPIKSDHKISLKPENSDLGSLRQDASYTVIFNLKNNFKNQVRIVGFDASCHCTAMEDPPVGEVLSSGDSIELPVQFSTGFADGPVSSIVMFAVDTPKGVINLDATIEGNVEPDFHLSSEELDFGIVYSEQEKELLFRVIPALDSNIEILGAECNGRGYTCQLIKHADTTKTKTVKVKYQPRQITRRGYQHGQLILNTNSSVRSRIIIPLRADVSPAFEVTPPRVVALFSSGSDSPIFINIKSEYDFKIIRWDSDSDFIQVSTPKFLSNSESSIGIHISRNLKKSSNSNLKLTLEYVPNEKLKNEVKQYQINVPVSVLVKSS
ncbi:hypothetical protein V6x_51420 [Gimesia chilikensis]|uniref:DUF1573 domain-containing protein n=1 Tax=Gimesia chilikensis TaxID=2605989 RepID=A0A517WJI1_9PLAN|nr:DUF1573 domain-containing protein [Gimesia chilikensis]QDU05405.1 hypothetical protein V6x_51420 [Gimesia chilikensis]